MKDIKKMKTIFSIIVITFLFAVSVYAEAPREFVSCDKDFSFNDLKYYKAQELVEGYCSCKGNAKQYNELRKMTSQVHTLSIRSYGFGSRQVRDAEMDMEEYQKKINTANSNASRILRFLEMEHKDEGIPKCESK